MAVITGRVRNRNIKCRSRLVACAWTGRRVS